MNIMYTGQIYFHCAHYTVNCNEGEEKVCDGVEVKQRGDLNIIFLTDWVLEHDRLIL